MWTRSFRFSLFAFPFFSPFVTANATGEKRLFSFMKTFVWLNQSQKVAKKRKRKIPWSLQKSLPLMNRRVFTPSITTCNMNLKLHDFTFIEPMRWEIVESFFFFFLLFFTQTQTSEKILREKSCVRIFGFVHVCIAANLYYARRLLPISHRMGNPIKGDENVVLSLVLILDSTALLGEKSVASGKWKSQLKICGNIEMD